MVPRTVKQGPIKLYERLLNLAASSLAEVVCDTQPD